MRSLLLTSLALAALIAAPATSFAQSSKAAAVAGEVAAIPDDGQFHTIFSTDIRTSKKKDLFMQVNLECALETETFVASELGNTDVSTAEARVQVRVVIDAGSANERVAEPGGVTFCQRKQEQEARFGGIIESCTDDDQNGEIDVATDCDVTEEELRLLIESMTANSFGFILDQLGSGRHDIEVQAAISESTDDANASANAYIGHGSITVEEVRLEHGAEITF